MTLRIPGYELDAVIGSGAHAEVWSARRDAATGQRVAIKWLPGATLRADQSARSESAVLAALDHPNLIKLVELVGCETGSALVMEYAGGGSLAALLRRRRRITPAEVAAALAPIAAALAHAHDRGVIHRDVSAANVLFSAAGHPKLADVGVALLAAGHGAPTDIVGTPAYLDPVIAGGSAAIAASDVFSLGAVALHALTGAGPWQRAGDDPVETVLQRAAVGAMTDLAHDLAHCPPPMAAVVQRALELQPYRRGTAAEFALDLRASIAPRPVVLNAGRLRPGTGRHSVDRRVIRSQAGADAAETGPDSDRVAVDLTRIAPQQAPPVTIKQVAGRRRGPVVSGLAITGGRTRRLILIGVCLLAAGVLAAAVAVTAVGIAGRTGGGSATRAEPRPASPRPPALDPSSNPSVAIGLLRTLDERRAAAFAARRPELLTGVYDSAVLLALDTARLQSAVPQGCGLFGLSTVYSGVRVLPADADGWRLSVVARLEGAELRCAGRAARPVMPGPPAKLKIVLRSGSAGFRIADERTDD